MNIVRDIPAAPGPKGHPILGVLPELRQDRLSFLMDAAHRYGAVVRMRVGPLTLYQVNHPDGVQRVLQENNHNYTKRTPLFKDIRRFLGDGLLVSDGAYWLRQRRLMQPAFHRQRITAFGEMMVYSTQAMLERWQSYASDGQAFNMLGEMMRLTLDIVCRALFSVDIERNVSAVDRSVTTLISDAIYRFDHPFYPEPWLPTPRNRRYLRAVQTLDQIIYSIIDGRRRKPVEANDLLAMLLEMRDDETSESMNDRQLRDEVITLLIAGHETTATTLAWAAYLLASHPQVEMRWRDEIARVLAGRTPGIADLANLPYTRMVIDETMRLYPPAWITNRRAEAEDVICGYTVPAGAEVSVSPYVTHHLAEFWHEPDRFNPERFAPEISNGRPRYAYFPFGGGPRQCIGNSFALVEAQLVLAMIGQRYHMALAPGHTVRPEPLVTLRPYGGLWMTIQTAKAPRAVQNQQPSGINN